MNDDNKLYGVCGVYCGQCHTMEKVHLLAMELKKLIIDDYDWVANVVDDIDYTNFLKGLEWFSKQHCPTCVKISDPWCEVRKCEKIINKELKSCLLCEEFLNCPRTEYQRDRYPFVIDRYHRVKQIGFEKHLEEEEKRAKEGVRLIDIRKY